MIIGLLGSCVSMSGCSDGEKSSWKGGDGFISVEREEDTLSGPDTAGMGDLEKKIVEHGLVDVQEVVPSVRVALKYSTKDNFLGQDVYGDLEKAYLQPEVAQKLELAQLFLQSRYPSYSLIIYDGVRPKSVQWLMWESIDGTPAEKDNFLAHPKYGSLHNYGAAVDVSIVDQYGDPLDMGTPFDHRGELAYPSKEGEMLEQGKLTQEQVENRRLLRRVMGKAGFNGIRTEWWHFSACSRQEAARKYEVVP